MDPVDRSTGDAGEEDLSERAGGTSGRGEDLVDKGTRLAWAATGTSHGLAKKRRQRIWHQGLDADECWRLMQILSRQLCYLLYGTAQGACGRRGRLQ